MAKDEQATGTFPERRVDIGVAGDLNLRTRREALKKKPAGVPLAECGVLSPKR
jgi:hypothetical protein